MPPVIFQTCSRPTGICPRWRAKRSASGCAFLLKPVDVETLQFPVAGLVVGGLSGASVKPAVCDPAPYARRRLFRIAVFSGSRPPLRSVQRYVRPGRTRFDTVCGASPCIMVIATISCNERPSTDRAASSRRPVDASIGEGTDAALQHLWRQDATVLQTDDRARR